MSSSISQSEQKILWGRSGNVCAIPGCNSQLTRQGINEDSNSVIGEMAHIFGENSGAARYDAEFPIKKLNKYENLILLCPTCHTTIDKNTSEFTIEKLKETPELKFSNSSDLVRKAVLLKVAELDVSIYALIIKKEYTKKDLKENIRILYNYLIKILLESVIKEVNQKEELFIFLDKCMPYSKIENFGDYIKTEFYSLYSSLPKLEINHDNSLQNGGLQVTDFICGAFGYKYNKKKLSDGCDEYTRIIQKRIVSERSDFFKKN